MYSYCIVLMSIRAGNYSPFLIKLSFWKCKIQVRNDSSMEVVKREPGVTDTH